MTKTLSLAAMLSLGVLMLAMPTAQASPAAGLAGLKSAGTSVVDTVRCRRWWRCHHGHCHWWKRCW